jgi:hypothetical protein
MMNRMMEIMKPVKTHYQQVFTVKIEGENIPVDSGSNFLFMIPFGKIRKK